MEQSSQENSLKGFLLLSYVGRKVYITTNLEGKLYIVHNTHDITSVTNTIFSIHGTKVKISVTEKPKMIIQLK